MEDKQEILKRFASAKDHMIMCIDKFETTEPTNKEVWEFMLSVATLRLEEAVCEDAGEYHERWWQNRIKFINAELEVININEQAEQNRATNLHEQGLKDY